ncbi:hypothetical protein TRIUR3_19586 [Triticum urartu]|uniref:Uncharacterized protein n=2 Tax=Triticum TaxID=4564 RepID=A0A9R1BKD6_TRITD|nr:hypothetical protein TRIUR3_19586 [Triticum urartu]VAI71879.1 unnamed protein product [Triticum turgidum subsp. durum]
MRIRRRPQQPSPYTAALLHHQQQYRSDPSTSTHQTPRNAEERGQGRGGDEEEEEGRARPPHPHANADLGRKPAAARRLALPQDNAVEGQGAAAEHGADGAHSSSNGHGGVAGWKPDVACTGAGERAVKVEDPVANGVAALSDVKEEKNGSGGAAGGAKKRRGPAVLMEGSRQIRELLFNKNVPRAISKEAGYQETRDLLEHDNDFRRCAFTGRRRFRQRRGAYGDFINFKIICRLSLSEMFIGIGCACVRS